MSTNIKTKISKKITRAKIVSQNNTDWISQS